VVYQVKSESKSEAEERTLQALPYLMSPPCPGWKSLRLSPQARACVPPLLLPVSPLLLSAVLQGEATAGTVAVALSGAL
jgi:hypothetical protein